MVHTLKGARKKPTQKNQLLPNFLIISGILLILSTIVGTQYYKPLSTLQGNRVVLPKTENADDLKPAAISFEGLAGEIKVGTGHFDGEREWDLSKDEALYLEYSGIPGKIGNTVIYGHNTKQVFSPLFNQKIGNVIKLKTNSGKTFTYKIDQIKSVLPTSVEILSQNTNEPKLTLFTCNGLFDSLRLVIIAKRV